MQLRRALEETLDGVWACRHVRAGRTPSALLLLAALACVLSGATPTRAAVLPEDRADYEYSHYVGGGQVIDGKSWLIRKKAGDHLSFTYNHLIDVVSGASIDVKLYASPYIEQRTQDSVSAQYLYGKSTYSVSMSHSYEPDYRSNSAVFSISQDMFGDLTTVSMSFRRTWNDVYKMECAEHSSTGACEDKIHDPTFGKKDMDENSYGVGLTQILTRNLILAVNYELITDQGWLANPYRDYVYLDPTSPKGFSTAAEIDPNTRTSNAIGTDLKYYLPFRAALDLQARYFQDTWGIHAETAQLGYTQPWRHWIFDATFRYYTQTAASFYSNAFAYAGEYNFVSRNRELSDYDSFSGGVGASYQFAIPKVPWIQRSTFNLRYTHLVVNYKDFQDLTEVGVVSGVTIANAPLYKLDVNMYQAFISLYF